METLLVIGIILLCILNILFILVLFMAFKFLQDLRYLLHLMQQEADKVMVDIANVRSKLISRSSWLSIGLGLIGRRQLIKKIAEGIVKK